MLIASDAAAVALCGIGGIGKSTLAALVCEHAERERRAGRAPFHDEAILLRINENTTFLELATNIFAATGNPMPDFSGLPVQNQAFAIFNALDTASLSRLIILDQFENFLDEQSGKPLPTSVGIGELLDALNSQPRSSRILLTSRARPRGTRDDNPTALSVYRVGGLNEQEGVAYLCSYGVKATEADLREAVKRCQGHALSLRLIHTLLQTYTISLAILLHNSDYRQLWNGKIAENLLDRIFNNLPLPSQQLLCAFSVYREAVPVEAALAIHDMSRELAFKCLENLLLQHLIQGKDGAYQLHPIVSDYAYDHFARRVKHVS